MKEHSNEAMALRGAFARAALAVFTFAALTAGPLLGDRQLGDREQPQVASVSEPGTSSIHEDASCRT